MQILKTAWDYFQTEVLGMSWLNRLIGTILNACGLDTTGRIGGSIQFFIYDTIKIMVLLGVLILVISYIQSYFPPERTKKILGRFHGIGANIIAALLGTVTPFCSCSSIPLFIGFTSAGLPLGVTFSFLISSPMVDLGSLVLLMSIFGWKVALLYVVLGLVIAVIGGTLIEKLHLENQVEEYIRNGRSLDQYDEVTLKNLRAYKVWLIESYKPKTVNLRLRAMNCYLESIGKDKWKQPFVRVQQKAFLENVISEADYEYFKNCLKRDDELFWYFVIRFLAATGARVSELIQIKVEHIKRGHLDLYSKGGKLRRIYIPKALQDEALSWLSEKQQESGFIFLNKYGERITTRGISGQLKKLAVRYNINPAVVYPHSFRHRFAKSFLERCNDIAFLADLMGHESIETTRIYLRKTSTEQREIVDKIVDW